MSYYRHRRNPHYEVNRWKEFLWDLTHLRDGFKDFKDGLRLVRELIASWK